MRTAPDPRHSTSLTCRRRRPWAAADSGLRRRRRHAQRQLRDMLRKGSLLATDPPLSSEAMNSAMPDAAQTTEPGTWPSAAPGSSAEAASPAAGGDLVADEEPPAPAGGRWHARRGSRSSLHDWSAVCRYVAFRKRAQTEAAQT